MHFERIYILPINSTIWRHSVDQVIPSSWKWWLHYSVKVSEHKLCQNIESLGKSCPAYRAPQRKKSAHGNYPGVGDSAYERGGDARRKFWIKLLKETDLGVAELAFFDPLKETMLKHRQYTYFYSGALWVRKFGKLSIRENLVMT